jgi:hypothetical protein
MAPFKVHTDRESPAIVVEQDDIRPSVTRVNRLGVGSWVEDKRVSESVPERGVEETSVSGAVSGDATPSPVGQGVLEVDPGDDLDERGMA